MKALGLPVKEKKNFEIFPPCSHVQTCDPQGAANLDPRGIILTNLEKIHEEMLYTNIKAVGLPVSKKKNFEIVFVLIFQLVTPGAGQVLTPGASYEHTW